MNRVLPAAVAAIALIAVSTQLSFAQPAPSGNDNTSAPAPNPGIGTPPGVPHAAPPPRFSPPAKFVFRRGLAAITCPPTIPLQDCVNAATQLANNLSRIHAREHRNQAQSYQKPMNSNDNDSDDGSGSSD